MRTLLTTEKNPNQSLASSWLANQSQVSVWRFSGRGRDDILEICRRKRQIFAIFAVDISTSRLLKTYVTFGIVT